MGYSSEFAELTILELQIGQRLQNIQHATCRSANESHHLG